MEPLLPNPTDEEAHQPVEPGLARTVGAVILATGVALLVFLGWATYRMVSIGNKPNMVILVVATVTAVITIFCLSVGYRLALNHPNKNGSILSPFGWYSLVTVFWVVAVALAVSVIWTGDYAAAIIGAVGSAIVGFWCLRVVRKDQATKTE